jgi:hypothetical protein
MDKLIAFLNRNHHFFLMKLNTTNDIEQRFYNIFELFLQLIAVRY